MSRNRKREEFMSGKARYRGPNRVVMLIFVLVAAVGIVTALQLTKDTAPVSRNWEGGSYNIGYNPDFNGQIISMTDTKLELEGESYLFTVDEVEKAKLIFARTDYKYQQGNNKAVMAFVSPAGRIVLAMAMCEPCRSERFHIEGNDLVCDTCGTRWQLADLHGIIGGCVDYPPEELPYVVKNGMLYFDTSDVKEWQPRI